MSNITEEQELNIEHSFMIRMQEFGYKPDTRKYNEAQSHYFVGAMIALGLKQHTFWQMCIMSGRSIIETRNNLDKNGK